MQINRRPFFWSVVHIIVHVVRQVWGGHMKKFSKESKHDLIHFQQKRLFFLCWTWPPRFVYSNVHNIHISHIPKAYQI